MGGGEKKPFFRLTFFLGLLALFAAPSSAQELLSRKLGAEKAPWSIEAERLVHDKKSGTYVAEGDVKITSGDKSIRAQKLTYYIESQMVELPGSFTFSYGEDYIEGASAKINLGNETGWVKEGRVFIKENNLTVRGRTLQKTGPFSFRAEDAEFTTCDIEDPDWLISADRVDVTYEGYGLARDVVFRARGLPVVYTPLLPFPAKRKRQTGFLLPSLGYTELGGADVDLPFFWAPRDDFDATLYTHYMSERGVMEGLETRFFLGRETKGFWRFDYLQDGLDREDRREAGFYAETDERWWLRAKNDFSLPFGVEGRLDLDLASDRDYLGEFKSGFSGYNDSDKALEKFMGRGLINDKNSLIRESVFNLTRPFDTILLTGELHYFEDLNLSRDETTLSQLPRIEASALKQRLFGSPLFWEGEASYVHFYRREGTRGHRFDVFPKVSLPFRVSYLDFEPSVGLRETAYYLDAYGEPAGSDIRDRSTHHREIYELQGDVSTRIARIYDTDTQSVDKLRHEVKPFTRARYVPDVNQRKNPFFDEEDRMERETTLTYGITNNLTAKYFKAPGAEPTYFDLLKLTVEQTYDFNEAERNSELWRGRTPFSDVRLDAELSFTNYLEAEYKAAFSPYEYRLTRNEVLLILKDLRGDYLELDYRFLKRTEEEKFEDRLLSPGQLPVSTSREEVEANLNIVITPRVSLELEKGYSLSEELSLKTAARLKYKARCWSVTFGYEDEPGDMRVMLTFTLEGLGGF